VAVLVAVGFWSLRLKDLLPVIAAVVAVAGAWGAAIYSRRTEHEKWLRQERLEAWSELSAVSNDGLRLHVRMSEGGRAAQEAQPDVAALLARMHLAVSRTILLGPGVMAQLGNMVARRTARLFEPGAAEDTAESWVDGVQAFYAEGRQHIFPNAVKDGLPWRPMGAVENDSGAT
jgi:hypothetical protein